MPTMKEILDAKRGVPNNEQLFERMSAAAERDAAQAGLTGEAPPKTTGATRVVSSRGGDIEYTDALCVEPGCREPVAPARPTTAAELKMLCTMHRREARFAASKLRSKTPPAAEPAAEARPTEPAPPPVAATSGPTMIKLPCVVQGCLRPQLPGRQPVDVRLHGMCQDHRYAASSGRLRERIATRIKARDPRNTLPKCSRPGCDEARQRAMSTTPADMVDLCARHRDRERNRRWEAKRDAARERDAQELAAAREALGKVPGAPTAEPKPAPAPAPKPAAAKPTQRCQAQGCLKARLAIRSTTDRKFAGFCREHRTQAMSERYRARKRAGLPTVSKMRDIGERASALTCSVDGCLNPRKRSIGKTDAHMASLCGSHRETERNRRYRAERDAAERAASDRLAAEKQAAMEQAAAEQYVAEKASQKAAKPAQKPAPKTAPAKPDAPKAAPAKPVEPTFSPATVPSGYTAYDASMTGGPHRGLGLVEAWNALRAVATAGVATDHGTVAGLVAIGDMMARELAGAGVAQAWDAISGSRDIRAIAAIGNLLADALKLGTGV